MVGVQDEQQVKRLGRDRIDLQRAARHFEHHVQEAVHVLEVVARVAQRPAHRMAMAGGGDRRQLGDQADRGEAALLRIVVVRVRSEEHTSELQSLMRISYSVFCLKKKNTITYKVQQ